MKKLTGFTLIELLVVVAIIGVLAVVVILNLTASQAKSNDARRKSDVLSIKKAVDAFQSEYDRYPICETKITACAFSSLTSGDNGDNLHGTGKYLDSTLGDIAKLSQYLPVFPTDPKMEYNSEPVYYQYADIMKSNPTPGSFYGILVAMEVLEGNLNATYHRDSSNGYEKTYYYCRTGTTLHSGMWKDTIAAGDVPLCNF